MGQDIKQFIVAICDQHSEILGTGFVIAPNVVATCAHVIAAANVDPGGSVAVKIPDASTLYQAEVLANCYDFHNDVAILKCCTALPATVQPAILGRWQEATHTRFLSYGYRPLDIYGGNPAEGQLLREVSDIKPRPGEPHPTHPVLSLSSQQISPGMSGSPVYVSATDRVVGMITAIWNSAGRDRDTAFAVSAEAIVAAWPAVALQPSTRKAVTSPQALPPTSAWIESYGEIRPLPHNDDAIATMLKGYTPFPHQRAEHELPFLFGSTGGFWSGHTVYAQITSDSGAQVVLAEAGAGKTALAYALRQVGTPEGTPLPHTLPVLLTDNLPLTPANAKDHICRALLTLLHHNPALLAHFSTEEKTFVLEFLVSQFGQTEVARQVQAAMQQDRNLQGIIGQFSKLNQSASVKWLGETQQLVNLFGFRQIVLAIDANRRPAGEISGWLKRMQNWGNFDINPVLLLPLDRQPLFADLLVRADIRVLTWTERQLMEMANWRFERLVNRIGVRLSLEELFEGEMLTDFVRLSNRSPRRMAGLWAQMAEHHAINRPTSRTFSWADLSWATEQVGQ